MIGWDKSLIIFRKIPTVGIPIKNSASKGTCKKWKKVASNTPQVDAKIMILKIAEKRICKEKKKRPRTIATKVSKIMVIK